MSTEKWEWASPPKGKPVHCVVCNHKWEAVGCDGYYECPDCGYLNPIPWEPPAPEWDA